MSDFKKILAHPEKDKIIGKLVNGESAKDVAQYLKLKYNDKDSSHLRLSAALLEEFIDKYLDQYKFLNKIVDDEKSGKTDKIVYESLLNNKAWKDRIAGLVDDELDLKKKIREMLVRVEVRAEQVFDKIQENPGNFKGDYVLLKYFEAITQMMNAADKIVNERPDKLIQHNISIQMVEQHSVAFQEAIRELLVELDPEISARFMELLTRKLSKLKSDDVLTSPQQRTIEARTADFESSVPIALLGEDYSFAEEEQEGANES
jgi:hypothetical protein